MPQEIFVVGKTLTVCLHGTSGHSSLEGAPRMFARLHIFSCPSAMSVQLRTLIVQLVLDATLRTRVITQHSLNGVERKHLCWSASRLRQDKMVSS